MMGTPSGLMCYHFLFLKEENKGERERSEKEDEEGREGGERLTCWLL